MPADRPAPDRPSTHGHEPASWPRRIGALVIDWVASSLVVLAVIGGDRWSHDRTAGWYVLGVFALECAFGWALAGASFGQLATRVRVLRVDDGRPLTFLIALLRAVLVCLVIPPLVFRADGRGLHDLAAGSAAYRLPPAA